VPILNANAIAAYAAKAGFRNDVKIRGVSELVLAVAIALGESGGNTQAHNAKPPDNSFGLMQINMIGGLGPARRKQFGISSNEELYRPDVNMKAARQVFVDAGNSFRPWSVYTSGSYLRYLTKAQAGVASPEMVESTASSLGLPDIGGIGDMIGFLTSGSTWIRIGQFLGGGILVIVAVMMLAGKNAGQIAQVVPVGKALRAVKRVT